MHFDKIQINHVEKRDEGIYECQIGTSPPKGQRILLTIVGTIFETFLSTLMFQNLWKQKKTLSFVICRLKY